MGIMERKRSANWQTHIKWTIACIMSFAGTVGWHETHPILRTINHAINTAHNTVTGGFVGHFGCVPFDIRGNNINADRN